MLESQVHISPDTINRLMGTATLAAEPGLRPEKPSPLNEPGFVDFKRHSLPDGTPLIMALKGSYIPAVRSSDQEDYYVG